MAKVSDNRLEAVRCMMTTNLTDSRDLCKAACLAVVRVGLLVRP